MPNTFGLSYFGAGLKGGYASIGHIATSASLSTT